LSFKQIRIALLLLVLVVVVHHHFNDRSRVASWKNTLFVAVYPVNADGSSTSRRHIESLEAEDFEPVEQFIRSEAQRYEIGLDRPVYVELGAPIRESLPMPPVGGNFLERALWIAKIRWWRWRFDHQGMDPDVIILARYFDPADSNRLPHSTGVEQIRIAIANLFASDAMRGENRVVLAHEFMHTIGASDKYDLESGLPIYPEGFADPEANPPYPQRQAEIMAGRIPISESSARQASGLAQVVVGPMTAAEIGWNNSSNSP